jgi:hypothetical protein
VRKAAMLGLLFLPLRGVEADGFEVADFVCEQFAFARGTLLRAFARRALRRRAAPRPMQRRHLASELLGPGVGIEQLALALAPQQQLMVVLAVDVDEALAKFTQLRHRGGAAVHERTRASRGIHRAAHEAGAVALLEVLGFEPGAHGGHGAGVEIGAHLGALRPGAHHGRIGAVAERQLHRIHEDRLARAGLAGERGEARGEFQVEPVDDDVVADGKRAQHGANPAPAQEVRSVQRSFWRSIEK